MKIRESILQLKAYQPGKPISEVQREYGLDRVVKLASNENPMPPSPLVISTIQEALKDLNRYPDAAFYDLREGFSSYYKVAGEQITFGNGSNELIDLLIRVFCQPGETILTSQGSFIAYGICSQAAGVGVLQTPLTRDYSFDLQAMSQLYQEAKEKPRLIFIANPNNPTGTYVGKTELLDFLKSLGSRPETIVVFDEAYFEFVRAPDYPDALEILQSQENIVVLKTLSKVFGLAGLRFGALVADPKIVDLVDRVRNPFNVNSLAQVAALAAIKDMEYLKKIQQLNWDGLDYFYEKLGEMGLPYCPSQANFVFFDSQRPAPPVFEALLKRGVILRALGPSLPTQLRMSVGFPEENHQAIKALEEVLPEIPLYQGNQGGVS